MTTQANAATIEKAIKTDSNLQPKGLFFFPKGYNVENLPMSAIEKINNVDLELMSNRAVDVLLAPFYQKGFAVGIITSCEIASKERNGDTSAFDVKIAIPHEGNKKDLNGKGRMTVQQYHFTSYDEIEIGTLYVIKVATVSIEIHQWFDKESKQSRKSKWFVPNDEIIVIKDGKQKLRKDLCFASRFDDEQSADSRTDIQGNSLLNVGKKPVIAQQIEED